MYRMVLNGMRVPRAELLITHVKGLEGDLELVPKESLQKELFCQQPMLLQ